MKTRTEWRLWSYGIRLAFVLLFGLGLTQTAWAWGETGHRLIARIAEKMITPSTREEIGRILKGKSMAEVALWADQIKKERPETAVWHYVKFSSAREWEESTPELGGSSVLSALSHLTDQLQNSGVSDSERREALMFVIHLVGDLNQPMHCAPDGDFGGNTVAVSFFEKETNLHKVWDSCLLDELQGSENEKLAALEHVWGAITESERKSADFTSWAAESNQVARWHAYILPENHQLGDSYVRNNLRSCSRQIWLSGIRLANLLNSILNRVDEVHLTASVHSD
ncbi:MAG: S1/P1 nuclease [Candidatus Riflebacteria bacterium]|nr:S1/P1 nuclease [Candidatus Riflebacteria bacterium]